VARCEQPPTYISVFKGMIQNHMRYSTCDNQPWRHLSSVSCVHLVLFPQILWVRKSTPSGSSVGISKRLCCVYLLNVHPRLLIIICISLLVCVCERQNQDGSKHGSKAHLSVCYHHKCCHHHHHHHYSEQSSEARYVIYDCFS